MKFNLCWTLCQRSIAREFRDGRDSPRGSDLRGTCTIRERVEEGRRHSRESAARANAEARPSATCAQKSDCPAQGLGLRARLLSSVPGGISTAGIGRRKKGGVEKRKEGRSLHSVSSLCHTPVIHLKARLRSHTGTQCWGGQLRVWLLLMGLQAVKMPGASRNAQ